MAYVSHRAEKDALRASYQQLVNRFHKKVEKTNLPEGEKARRREQKRVNATRVPVLIVSAYGKQRWRRAKAA